MRELGVFLVFAAALLHLVVERQQSVPVLLFVAGLIGFLIAGLAPRRGLLFGLAPPLGGFVISLVLALGRESPNLTGLLDIWVPLGLAGLVGAFAGSRFKLFNRRRRSR